MTDRPPVAAIDGRTPVIVGAGQVTLRERPDESYEPIDLMAEAAAAAVADTAAARVRAAIQSVRVVASLSWRYPDPGALLASRLGMRPAETLVTNAGGNWPQALLNRTADQITRGELRAALLVGGELWRTRMALRREGLRPWTKRDGTPAPVLGGEFVMTSAAEAALGIVRPVQIYPVFECALRAAAGTTWDDHVDRMARLWAGFSDVAARNPYAWIRDPKSPEELRTPSPGNRIVGFPYTKFFNSNNDVDQAAALVVCSVESARELGVPPERWVFPWAGAEAADTAFVSNRLDLHSSPAIRIAARRLLDLAGVGVDDLTHVDLYSCFPSAVQVAAKEIGLRLDRPLTVTGGLTFAGGPWNNYVMHAIATMLGILREDPSAFGLCTAVGGFLTKHAIGVYSGSPPPNAFRWENVQDEVDSAGSRPAADAYTGRVTVEAYTVFHDREAPPTAIVAALTPTGARTWATSLDPAVAGAFLDGEHDGRAAQVANGKITLGD